MAVELATRYDPAQIEDRIYRFWESGRLFHTEPDQPGESYVIVIPPPNVTSQLHMGHALNNAIQDILIRFRRMQGRNTLWLPGTDHAGIATQNVVERQLATEGLHRQDLGRDKFVQRAWDWKARYGGRIVFWGGGIDTQGILPHGTPGQVRDDVRRNVEVLAQGGGYVFNTVHNIQSDVPPENIMAMWEALQEF